MGTITKYYSFIDEESKSILNSLMEESSSYNDFVQRLCEVVLENETPINLSYIAAVQAWWARSRKNMELIQEKFSHVPSIRPWGYVHGTAESDQVKHHDAVVESIDRAIASSIDDWVEVELHLLHSFFHCPHYGDISHLLEPLKKAELLIDANPCLSCYEPLIHAFQGNAKWREGDTKGAIAAIERGLFLAQKNDDFLFKYVTLLWRANDLKDLNIQDSLLAFEELYELTQDLHVPYFVAEVMNDSALAFEIAGEYDMAISCHKEDISIAGYCDTIGLILSRIYATLGDGQESLEWANRAFEYVENLEFQTLYLRKAWALALLNRLDEAEENLDTAHSLVMKTGSEVWLGSYYFTAGVIELERGDTLVALDSLEKALDIAERYRRGILLNDVLINLVRVELALAKASGESSSRFVPGRWLSKLENYARDNDLPGIKMYAALLKSEFYLIHGQTQDAHETLVTALTISDSLGVKTLRKMINDRIREVNQLLREEAVSSKRRRE